MKNNDQKPKGKTIQFTDAAKKAKEKIESSISIPNKVRSIDFIPDKRYIACDIIPKPKEMSKVDGIFIPESVQKDNMATGLVIAVGSSFEDDYSVGDIVGIRIDGMDPMRNMPHAEIDGKPVIFLERHMILGKYKQNVINNKKEEEAKDESQ